MADAERLEIGHQRGRVVEAEAWGKLETISRQRDGGLHHPSPMLQNTDHGGSVAGGSPPQTARPDRTCPGRSAWSPERLASRSSVLPSASDQLALRICPSWRALPNRAPARRGAISLRRVIKRSRTSASRSRPFDVVAASQSSTAERKVASTSGSGISSPNA